MIAAMSRAVLLLVLLLLAAGVGIGFCVPGPGSRAAVADVPGEIAGVVQGHVYTGITDRPETLNPFKVTGGAALRYVLGFTHDGLLDTDPVTGDLRGALAQSWLMDPSGLAFTATLRPGVVFADGSPVTPDDVLFTWQVASTEADLRTSCPATRRACRWSCASATSTRCASSARAGSSCRRSSSANASPPLRASGGSRRPSPARRASAICWRR
jgi:ABC-type transport system substrate-binding protein